MLNLSLRAILAGALALALLLAFALMWLLGWGFFKRETADFRGQTDVVEQVSADADYRIGQYEEFYDRCWAIVAIEGEITLAEQAVDDAATDWDTSQTKRNLQALRNQRLELISAYNSDASKADTAANFRASDLPAEIDPDKENTECTAS